MQALKVLVVVMGVMIVAGVATLGVLLTKRVGAISAPVAVGTIVLDEPAGTRIVAAMPGGETIVVQLQGGGPDRVTVVDARSGRIVGRIGLAK